MDHAPAEARLSTHLPDGRRLAWRRLGAGPPLLLINGYAATSDDWDPAFLECLAREHTMLCPDNRGLGASTLGDEVNLSIDTMAADVVALLDAAAIERAAIVGWSMGGFIAQQVAALAPERVTALVLLSTDAGGAEAVRCEPGAWSLLTDHESTPREQAAGLISVLFPPFVADEIDIRFGQLVADARAAMSVTTLRAQERAIDAWYTGGSVAPGGGVPVLAVSGALDEVIPAANLTLLDARWPNCQIMIFGGGGHAFMAQGPERHAGLISKFVAGQR